MELSGKKATVDSFSKNLASMARTWTGGQIEGTAGIQRGFISLCFNERHVLLFVDYVDREEKEAKTLDKRKVEKATLKLNQTLPRS